MTNFQMTDRFLLELGLITDLILKINHLNSESHGRSSEILYMLSAIKAFKLNLDAWIVHLRNRKRTHLPVRISFILAVQINLFARYSAPP